MSSPSTSSTAAISTLTPQELSRMLLAPHMTLPISKSFENYPTSTATLRHYAFLSQSIVTLEEELERHQLEREQIFDHMMQSKLFRRKIQPIVMKYRPTAPRRTQFHSYGRTSPSPSLDSYSSSIDNETTSPQSIKILPEEALAQNSTPPVTSSPESIHNPIDEEPGSRENPIVVQDDEDLCTRCKQQGHQLGDCNTPMRTFHHCEICAWTKQDTCTHIDASPVWLQELRASIERNNKESTTMSQ
jgi:hypothetical protein